VLPALNKLPLIAAGLTKQVKPIVLKKIGVRISEQLHSFAETAAHQRFKLPAQIG